MPDVADASLPIGLFDSGVGGLSVARRLAELAPSESTLYFGDSARCPYGPRPLPQVRRFGLEIIDILATQGVKLVVVACNTSTAAGVVEAAADYPFPVLGIIEPGARLAARTSRNGRVGVLATAGTVASGAYQRALRAINPGLEVAAEPCPPLVPLVEAGQVDGPEAEYAVAGCLRSVLAAGIDTLVLGCTHYPVLAPVIRRLAGPGVQLVDPAKQVAREALAWLHQNGLRQAGPTPGSRRFLTSGDPKQFLAASLALWPGGVSEAEQVPVLA
ncbi:MAG: glutamate racemase [Firmicutes bacterium]|nr:glutamate racemase [Bacillota bacterium]